MHRIKYSSLELEDLYHKINEIKVRVDEYFNIRHDLIWYLNNPHILYDNLKDSMEQFPFEVMYHYPLKSILTLVAHHDPLVRIIVTWRIQIPK